MKTSVYIITATLILASLPLFVAGQDMGLPASYRIYQDNGYWVEEYTLNGEKNLLSYPEKDYALMDGIKRGEEFLQDSVGWASKKWAVQYDVPKRIAYITSDAGGSIVLDYPDSISQSVFTNNVDNVYKIASTGVMSEEVSTGSLLERKPVWLYPLFIIYDILAPVFLPLTILTSGSTTTYTALMSPIGERIWKPLIDRFEKTLVPDVDATPEYIAGLKAVNESVDFLKTSINQYGAVYNYTTIKNYTYSQVNASVNSVLLALYPVHIVTSTYSSGNSTHTISSDSNAGNRNQRKAIVDEAIAPVIEGAVGELLQYQLSYFLPRSEEGIVAEPATGIVSSSRAQAAGMTDVAAAAGFISIFNFLIALVPFVAPILDYTMKTVTVCLPLLLAYSDMYVGCIAFYAVLLLTSPIIVPLSCLSDFVFLFVRTVPFGYAFEPLLRIAFMPLNMILSLVVSLVSSFVTVPFIGSAIRGSAAAILVPLMFLPSSRFFPKFTSALQETIGGAA